MLINLFKKNTIMKTKQKKLEHSGDSVGKKKFSGIKKNNEKKFFLGPFFSINFIHSHDRNSLNVEKKNFVFCFPFGCLCMFNFFFF